MNTAPRTFWWFDLVWLLAWGVGSSAWCLTASRELSATFDEPTYIARGLERWQTGSYEGLLHLGTMPLPVDVITGPLHAWERCEGVRFDPNLDFAQLLPWARAGTLVFWWILLGYGWRSGRSLAGPWGGRLAVALLACEPGLLAHATLATTDIAITACLLAFVYHFQAGAGERWPWRIGVPAFWLAAAILAKASGLVFGPICMLAVELERALRVPTDESLPARLRTQIRWRDLALIMLGGILLTFLYCGSDWQPQGSFVKWAHALPAGFSRDVMVWTSEHLRCFPNAGSGILRQVTHNVRGHGVYLLGREDLRSLWYYFPVLLTMKTSAALLVALVAGLLLKRSTLRNWACFAAAGLAVFSVACRVQIGIRFMLPLMALLIVGVASGLIHWLQSEEHLARRRFLGFASAGLVLWTFVSAIQVWPEGLCFVNEFWGGTANGYAKVNESNYDWGQGLKELEAWHRANPGPLALWYFGADPAAGQGSAEIVPLHVLPIESGADVRRVIGTRRLAVSTSLLYCAAADKPALRHARDYLRTLQPIGRTTTFLIFQVNDAPSESPASVR